MSYVTLQLGATEKTLAAWNVQHGSTRRTHTDLRPDTFSFSIPVTSIATALPFAWKDKITVRTGRTSSTGATNSFSGGTVVFIGYRTEDTEAEAAGPEQNVRFTFANAWHWIERTQYQQSRCISATNLGGAISRTYGNTSDVILGLSFGISGEAVARTSGQQISDILTYALAQLTTYFGEAPLQVGSNQAAMALPIKQVQEISCAAAIEECLRLQPDASVAWDYTTTPPTVNVLVGGGSAVNLALSGSDWQGLAIRSRPELRARSVIIRYRTMGVAFVQDKWGTDDFTSNPDGAADTGPDGGPEVILLTVDLASAWMVWATASLNTESVDCNYGTGADGNGRAERRAWWAKFHKELSSTKIRFQEVTGDAEPLPNSTITNRSTGAAVSLATYPNMVVGQNTILPWMRTPAGAQVEAVDVDIVCDFATEATYDQESGAANPDADTTTGRLKSVRARRLHAQCTLTNASTGTFYSQSGTAAEDALSGVAKAIFDSLKSLQCEGRDVRVNAAANVTLLNSVNLTGGDSAWETMDAIIREIVVNDSTSERSITFGPRTHLDAPTHLALARWNRLRVADNTIGERASGIAGETLGL